MMAEPLTERFFHRDDALGIEEIYQEAFRIRQPEAEKIREQIRDTIDACRHGFTDPAENISEEDREFLQFYSMIISLGCDIYIKKRIMEKLIDAYNQQNKRDGKDRKKKE